MQCLECVISIYAYFYSYWSSYTILLACRENQVPPTFFSFALTCDDGTKLYGAALCIYDETISIQKISDVIQKSNYKNNLPSWLNSYGSIGAGFEEADMNNEEETIDDEGLNSQTSFETTLTSYSAPAQHFFMPKCLVLLSHHGFMDVWRAFLLHLYRISLVEAPLPIERYIINFVAEGTFISRHLSLNWMRTSQVLFLLGQI